MKATIDRAGRVVIPAAIRERAGLRPGTRLEVVLAGGVVQLVRDVPGPQLVRSGRRLVARPRVPPDARPKLDIAKLVEEERDRWPW